MLGNIIIILVLAAAVVLAVRSIMKRGTGGCCGGSCGCEAGSCKGTGDREESHYPYTEMLHVEDMECENCRNQVEHALNRLEGVWATADLKKSDVTVRMKEQIPREELIQRLRKAGYTVSEAGK